MNSSRISALRRWHLLLLASLLGMTLALPASAQWKWRDKKGQTQYSDLPPPAGVAEQDILQRPNSPAVLQRTTPATAPASAASAAPALVPKSTEPELEAKRKKVEQEAAEKKKAEEAKYAAAKAENCVRAKAQMRTLDSGIRVARINEKGEREFLGDAARAVDTQRVREAIASECN
jgi:Domain of unknown function (DUF4124)